jgi:hypothetical protein
MKKLTVLIMILGLTAGAQAGIGLPFNDNPATDNVLLTASSGIVIGIQSDDGLVCIVYLEPTDGVGQRAVPVRGDTIDLFPDVMTIASLGFVGLLLRRRSSRPNSVLSWEPLASA